MMDLVRWNPVKEMAALHNRINRLFDDTFFRTGWSDEDVSLGAWYPAVDMYDQDGHLVIKAELPGLSKKDISIDVKDGVLTLKGERSLENEVREENYYRKERAFGKFQRSFTLPADVDPNKIKAEFKDGLLKIEVPMPEEKRPKQITIH